MLSRPSFARFAAMLLAAQVGAFAADNSQGAASDPAPAAGQAKPQWHTDYEAAKSQAAAEHKDLLIEFTGSDWCSWCIRLDEEVFSQPGFLDAAGEQFVLVKLDFPQSVPQPQQVQQQNQRLQQLFAVQGYPSIFLADSDGRAFARTGYQAGGKDAYLKHLQELRLIKVQRDKLLLEAEVLTGAESAKRIDAALRGMIQTVGLLVGYEPLVDRVIELDADNAAGLKSFWGPYRDLRKIEGLVDGEAAELLAAIESFLAAHQPLPPLRQFLLTHKGVALVKLQKPDEAITAWEQALAAAPDTALARQQLPQLISQLRAGHKPAAGEEPQP